MRGCYGGNIYSFDAILFYNILFYSMPASAELIMPKASCEFGAESAVNWSATARSSGGTAALSEKRRQTALVSTPTLSG